MDLRAPIEAGRGARGGGSLAELGYYIFGEIGYAGDWRLLSTVRRIAANTGTVSRMVKHKSAPATIAEIKLKRVKQFRNVYITLVKLATNLCFSGCGGLSRITDEAAYGLSQ